MMRSPITRHQGLWAGRDCVDWSLLFVFTARESRGEAGARASEPGLRSLGHRDQAETELGSDITITRHVCTVYRKIYSMISWSTL